MDGPSLQTYVETRFNLLIEDLKSRDAAHAAALRATVQAAGAALVAAREASAAAQLAAEVRHQQRFEAQSDALAAAFLSQQTAMQTAFVVAEKAVQAALAAADRAVAKAEMAADKRFEALNELRQMLNDMVSNMTTRTEMSALEKALSEKITNLKEQNDARMAERMGIKGGWGYAVGVLGAVALLITLVVTLARVAGVTP